MLHPPRMSILLTITLVVTFWLEGDVKAQQDATPSPLKRKPSAFVDKDVCGVDEDCGPNEACFRLSVVPPCKMGRCQCKPCFVYNKNSTNSADICSPVQTKQICPWPNPCGNNTTTTTTTTLSPSDSADDTTNNNYYPPPFCDSVCSGAFDEIYPDNAFCQIKSGDSNGKVRCIDYDCFVETMDGRCEQRVIKGRGESCSTDCQCSSNMKCVGKCRCAEGLVWKGRACLKPGLGDTCSSDENCHSVGMNHIGGFVRQGAQCDQKLNSCSCAIGFSAASVNFFDHQNGAISVKRVCLLGDGPVSVNNGKQCNTFPQLITDTTNVPLMCSNDSFCFSCPEEEAVNDTAVPKGFCRKLRGEIKTTEKCLPEPDDCDNDTANAVSHLGKWCSRSEDCGANEECEWAPVEPGCTHGRCTCRRCYGANERGICAPMKLFKVGDDCLGTDNEIYQSGAVCGEGAIVVCDQRHHMFRGECVRTGYNRTYYSLCESDNDCDESLECYTGDRKVCDCGAHNEVWSDAEKRCVPRKFGDDCTRNEHCAGIAVIGDIQNRPVCSRLLNVCTQRLELDPNTNPDKNNGRCLICPEDDWAPSCRQELLAAAIWPPVSCYQP